MSQSPLTAQRPDPIYVSTRSGKIVTPVRVPETSTAYKVEQAMEAVDRILQSAVTNENPSPDTVVDGGKAISVVGLVPDKVSDVAEAVVSNGVPHFIHQVFEHMPHFLEALEEVAKIHPVTHAVAMTFKTICTLVHRHRSNEEKVVAVLVEMRDMLSVLLHLKIVPAGSTDSKGVGIEERMKILMEEIAVEMKKCANVCDAYCKAKIVAKVLKGLMWEKMFIDFTHGFSKRRTSLQLVLSAFTSLKVDQIDQKLDELSLELRRRNDEIIWFIQSHVPAEHREISAHIERKGGVEAVLRDDNAIRDLIALDQKRSDSRHPDKQVAGRVRDSERDARVQIQDIDGFIEQNLVFFYRKFEIQWQQLAEEMASVVHQEADRIITNVAAGPHDKIVDPDLRKIWKEMGWRGNVKARHLVLAIRDYYHDQVEERKRHERTDGHASSLHHDDWVLHWITMKRLQSITEAFNQDASGYATIAEVNAFSSSRPKDWSLAHWLAYWAVGWQNVATVYREKIHELFSKMFSLEASVHNANRRIVDQYLEYPFILTEKVRARFKEYVASEETRIKRDLESVKYHVDDLTTLNLVTGPGRIEKNLFPLLYLMIKRDFEVMRLCKTKVIDECELWNSIRSIWLVVGVVDSRHKELEDTFRHQNMDPTQQFRITYAGLFDHYHDPSVLFNRKALRDMSSSHHHHSYDDTKEAQDVDPGSVLNHSHKDADGHDLNQDLDRAAYEEAHEPLIIGEIGQGIDPVQAIAGTWHALLYGAQGQLISPMFSLHVQSEERSYMASGSIPGSSMFPNFTLTGECEKGADGDLSFAFVMKCSAPFESKCFRGHLSENGMTLSGDWEGQDDVSGLFVFSRLPAQTLSHRPSPMELKLNKSRALWKYAISATLDGVAHRRYSWSVFFRRRDIRIRYLDLLFRTYYGRPLDQDEQQELANCRQSLSPADARFYFSLCRLKLRTVCVHGVTCDSCGGVISGGRIVCIDCDLHSKAFSTIDLCEDPRCATAQINQNRRNDLPSPHLPSHNVFKTRRMLYLRNFGKVEVQVQDALRRAQADLEDAEERRCELLHSGTIQAHWDLVQNGPTDEDGWLDASERARNQEITALLARIDVAALVARASKLRGVPCQVQPLSYDPVLSQSVMGGMNYHVDILFDDKVVWICRIRRHNASSPPVKLQNHNLLSEAATLQFLASTTIPVPKVFDVAIDSPQNPVGVGYIMMEKLAGKPLEWYKLEGAGKQKILQQLAQIFIELEKHSLPSIGCLRPEDSSRRVGPLIAQAAADVADDGQLRLLGPFSSSLQYRMSSAHQQLQLIRNKEAYVKHPIDAYLVHRYLLDLMPSFVTDERGARSSFYLKHTDDKGDHIFVDDDLNIVGIIDWEGALTTSKQEAFSAPLFLLDVGAYYDGKNDLSDDEQLFASILETAGRPDMAALVRNGRIQHRLEFCLGGEIEDTESFPNMLAGLRAACGASEHENPKEDWKIWRDGAMRRYGGDEWLQRTLRA
ncbi:uncharacterized protein FIBRA_06862 [Fibroporia radiculosa]|uniref:Aminoglycoside phosphotransferase domain-containing protein n=1 Tax=Fibroporia radiculosa TaxID=599839 RepID=J4IBH6_9APHY|nr:uncharacterized protein FIBRA_06862 [Fibroporia radiculosa]CCM04676.1 predicted protein [Fibroporia radiculosa]